MKQQNNDQIGYQNCVENGQVVIRVREVGDVFENHYQGFEDLYMSFRFFNPQQSSLKNH